MKIVVDNELCEANGMCVVAAPEVFHLDDEDRLPLLIATPGSERQAELDEAVRMCPRAALRLEEAP